jgi:hypothetical protein
MRAQLTEQGQVPKLRRGQAFAGVLHPRYTIADPPSADGQGGTRNRNLISIITLRQKCDGMGMPLQICTRWSYLFDRIVEVAVFEVSQKNVIVAPGRGSSAVATGCVRLGS